MCEELVEYDVEPIELTEVRLGSWMTTAPYLLLPRGLMVGKRGRRFFL